MSWFHRDKEKPELDELRKIEQTDEGIKDDLDKLVGVLVPHLVFIKIKFVGGKMPEGPVTLTVGQVTVASIDGFDQNGNPFTGSIPTPSWSIDQPTLDSIAADTTNPANEDVTSLAAGVANLTATVQGPNGLLTDTEVITNVAVAPVLSSIKINFATPTGV